MSYISISKARCNWEGFNGNPWIIVNSCNERKFVLNARSRDPCRIDSSKRKQDKVRYVRAMSNWSSGNSENRRICAASARAINRVGDAHKYAQMDRRTIRQTQNCHAIQPRGRSVPSIPDRFARSTERRNPLIREFTIVGNNRRRYIVPPPPDVTTALSSRDLWCARRLWCPGTDGSSRE